MFNKEELAQDPLQEQLRFCTDCKHHIAKHTAVEHVQDHYCARTQRTDLITGELKFSYCFIERGSDVGDRCGKVGIWFERAEKIEEKK